MPNHHKNEYLLSLQDSFPVIAGYFIVSFVFGVSCIQAGLPLWLPAFISLMVYAGAGQFSFLMLFSAGVSITTIVLTTFLINLRHMLMSAYIVNIFDTLQIDKKYRWLYGYGLTDESFAFHSLTDNKNLSHKYFVSFNIFCHTSWILGALFGSLFGAWLITELNSHLATLQYALTAMMVYVLVVLSNSFLKTIVALVSVISMIVLSFIYQSHFNIFIATAISAGTGVWLKKKI